MNKLFSPFLVWLKLGLALLLIVGGVFIGWKVFGPKSGLVVNTSQAAVIKQMRDLQRLETASFTIEKIIDARTNGNVFQEILYGDKILLIAHGEVIAGFDLSQLAENAITIEGKKIKLRLPAPQVLVSRLDNQQTRVYDRQQGLLSQGQKDLETTVRQTAEQSIRQAACDSKILSQAEENGKKQLTALLQALGFTEVEFEVATGSCK